VAGPAPSQVNDPTRNSSLCLSCTESAWRCQQLFCLFGSAAPGLEPDEPPRAGRAPTP